MKKVILSSIFALALLATAGFGVNKSMKSDANFTDLALANVEALAQGEIEIPWICIDTSFDICVFDFKEVWIGYKYY